MVPKRYRQTDGQTTDCGITMLCVASHGKKEKESILNDHFSRMHATFWLGMEVSK